MYWVNTHNVQLYIYTHTHTHKYFSACKSFHPTQEKEIWPSKVKAKLSAKLGIYESPPVGPRADTKISFNFKIFYVKLRVHHMYIYIYIYIYKTYINTYIYISTHTHTHISLLAQTTFRQIYVSKP